MFITKQATHTLKSMVLPILLLASPISLAAEMPPPPGVLDSYQCVYQPGKNIDDLMAARDYYVKQAAKAGFATPPAYIWELAKGDAPIDVVWFDIHENLGAFAASADAAAGSAEIAASNERFDTVVKCQSGIGSVRPIFQRGEPDPNAGPSFVTSSACRLKHGQNQQNVGDLVRHIGGVMEGMGDKAPAASFIGDPITSGPNTPDYYIFSFSPNATAWSEFVRTLVTNPAGQMLGRHFNTVMDCNMSMWTGQWVIRPAE